MNECNNAFQNLKCVPEPVFLEKGTASIISSIVGLYKTSCTHGQNIYDASHSHSFEISLEVFYVMSI